MHLGRLAGALAVALLASTGAVRGAAVVVGQGSADVDFVPDVLFQLPRAYVCVRTDSAPVIDGRLDDDGWRSASWSEPFVDITGAPELTPRLRTRVKMLWDDDNLYVGAVLQEPHVRARVHERDAVIHTTDSNFEVFFDPDGDSSQYGELQVNAAGTLFDLLLPRPYKDGGFAVFHWDFRGLRAAVHVDGTIDDASDVDEGWSVELAFPWRGTMADFAHQPVPPRDGDLWRVNFSRVEWPDRPDGAGYTRPADAVEDNWVWSPQGTVEMHRPETWGVVLFRDRPTEPADGAVDAPIVVDPGQAARAMLHRVYYTERAYRARHGSWTDSFAVLGLSPAALQGEGEQVASLAEGIGVPIPGSLALEATESIFEAAVDVRLAGQVRRWHIRSDSRFWRGR